MSKDLSVLLSRARRLAPVIILGVAVCIGSTCARAQYRAAIGCEAVKIDEMSGPSGVLFDEIACKCFNKCLAPGASPPPASSAVQPTRPPAAGVPQAPSALADNRRFRMYEGRDVNGNDFKTLPGIDFSGCIDACRADRRCSSFSFDKWNRYCFLKNTVPTEVRIDPQSIVAVMSTATPVVSSAAVRIEKYANAIFYDPPFRQLSQSSYGACQSACESDNRCEVFSFIRSTRICRLIARPSEYFRSSDTDADSGVKRQPAPARGAFMPAGGAGAPRSVGQLPASIWNRNGSPGTLAADGATRRVEYFKPKGGLDKACIVAGAW